MLAVNVCLFVISLRKKVIKNHFFLLNITEKDTQQQQQQEMLFFILHKKKVNSSGKIDLLAHNMFLFSIENDTRK